MTPNGARLAEGAIKLVEDADAEFFNGVSARETNRLLRRLPRLRGGSSRTWGQLAASSVVRRKNVLSVCCRTCR